MKASSSMKPGELGSAVDLDVRLEKFARRISRVAGVGGWEVDLATGSVFWSEETARIHDCPPDYQLDLADGLKFYTEESRPHIDQAVAACMEEGKKWDLELTIRTATGRVRWVHTIGEAETEDGKIVRLLGTFQDITERVELRLAAELEHERWKNLIYNLRVGMVVVDGQGNHLIVNPAFEQMSGFSEEELLGVGPPHPYWDEEHLELIESAFQQSMQGDFATFELPFRRKDGSRFWSEVSPSCWRGADGEVADFYASVVDVTKRKINELALAETNRQLQESGVQLEVLRQRAEAANRAKSSFLATMSHEIRTPLNAVIGMASLLQTTELTEDQVEFTTTIENSGQALLALINDILDFSKIEAGELLLEETVFSVADCVVDAVDLFQASAQAKGLRLNYSLAEEMPRQVRGDVTRLRQVLINLLGNAVKFTHQGEVSVSGTAELDPGSQEWMLRFAVRDTGIGIEPKAQSKLFQPFTQADTSVTRVFGGTGLGLSISQRIVEAMGGEISLTSQPGCGSVFTFTVRVKQIAPEPVNEELSMAVATESGPQVSFGGEGGQQPSPLVDHLEQRSKILDPHLAEECPLQILVCEDHAINQRVIGHILRRFGYQPLFASDGVEGLEICSSRPVDFLLVDLQMPRMGGLDMVREVRSRDLRTSGGHRVCVAALTAAVLLEDQIHCLEAGMDFFLAKPVRPQNLANIIRQAWTMMNHQE
jgi:PAS domain S-box-containing protein